MVDFEGYYSFAADQVECVERVTNKDNTTYPFTVYVILKSGRKLGVNYKTQKDADNAKRVIVNRISFALRNDYEQLYNKLYLVEDCVKRIDKRQLRIWRQLRALLHLAVEEGDEP